MLQIGCFAENCNNLGVIPIAPFPFGPSNAHTYRMNFLYWFSLVLGGGMFALSLFGDLFGDHSLDSDSPGDLGTDGHVHAGDADWGKLFSLRNLTYFLFAFGAAGVLLSLVWHGDRDLLTAIGAGLTGTLAWTMSAVAFGYLRRTESGQMPGDSTLVGRVGQMTLPLHPGSTGKVMITRAGQTQEFLARPLADDEPGSEKWDTVVIVELRDGVAFVAPYNEREES